MFDWFNIFNRADFTALELVQKKYTVYLTGYGTKEILVGLGNTLNVTIDGIFLVVKFDDKNPYSRDGRAVYEDTNGDVWVGFEK